MIKLEKVNKYFNKHRRNQIHVINNTSLTLEDKGLVALLGPSGCGKTTLLNAIGGLDKINSGNIYINNERLSKRSVSKIDKIRNLNIGYIFQDYCLINNMTVFDNVALVLKINGINDKNEITKRVNYVLEKVGMYRFRNRYANMLSGGERQRVGIARAIVKDPSIIIADEPTGNLDSKNTIEIMNIIKAISKDRLVILVTHETELANFYASRILKISDGTITEDFINEHDNELDYRLDNKIYLQDMPKHNVFDDENINVNYYGDNQIKVGVNIVVKNGNIYIESNNKVEVIDNSSSIELVNDHYKKISKNIYEQYKFDFNNVINKDIKKKYVSIFNPVSLIKNGFRKVINYSVPKKLLLIGFFLSGIFITYSISSLYGINNIKDENFVTMNKDYLVIDSSKLDVSNFLKYESDSNVNYILPGDSNVTFKIKYTDYYQTMYYSDYITGSMSSIDMISSSDIVEGRMPNNSKEIVIDKIVFNNYYDNYYPPMVGINSVSKLFGKNLSVGKLDGYKIVGVVDKKSPSIYVNKSEFVNLIYNSGTVYSYDDSDYVDVVDSSSDKTIYDVDTFDDRITLSKGSMPNDYEVIVNEKVKDSYKINKLVDTKVNGKRLKVVGYYKSDEVDYMLTNNNTIKYEIVATGKDLFLSAKDKNKALDDYRKLGLNIKDSYTNSREKYTIERMKSMTTTMVFSGVILLISLIEIYLMMRSSFLSRIKEVGIFRAIGMKRIDIYKMFTGEIIAISTIASMSGVVFMSYILYQLSSLNYYSDKFLINGGVILTIIIVIYGFNLLVGLLPVKKTLKKTPAEIMSRSDV